MSSSTLADRVRARMSALGLNQEQVEKKADLSKGYLSRILNGERRNLGPAIFDRLAKALGVSAPWLASGLNLTGEMGPLLNAVRAVPNLQAMVDQSAQTVPVRQRLDEIPGYFDAEFEVGRLEPSIPREVFQEARATTFGKPPATITIEFLRDHVRFLDHHLNSDGASAGGAKAGKQHSETRVAQRSETRARSSQGTRLPHTKKRPA